jgi:D-3-phosphoglycerate dehydrogenase
MRILVTDGLDPAGLDLLCQAGMEVDERPGLAGRALQDALRNSDGCIVRSATKLTPQYFPGPGRLKAIVRAGVGVDNIAVDAATQAGVAVLNTPNGNTVSAAELTIGLMLALARHIPEADCSVKAGRWERARFVGTQLAGKTLGVVGLGRIGREVARRAVGLDMKPLGHDPFLSPDQVAQLGIGTASGLDELLARADVLTVHVPLVSDTAGLIGWRELHLLKPGAFVLNVARGGIIDELELAEGLCSGRVAGAAIDVFSIEPPRPDHPLLTAPNVLATPHLGASTREAQEGVAKEAAELMIDYLTSGDARFAINRHELKTATVIHAAG